MREHAELMVAMLLVLSLSMIVSALFGLRNEAGPVFAATYMGCAYVLGKVQEARK